MLEVIELKDVKTRKEHSCFGCLRKYPAGTEMRHSVEVDGILFHVYLCQECLSFRDTLPMNEIMDGFYEGDLLEYEDYPNRQAIRDEVYKYNHPESIKVNEKMMKTYEIKRTKGETRTHVYYDNGYPIRSCTWTQPENEFIENGDAELCKNCSDYLEGKRKIAFAPKVEVNK